MQVETLILVEVSPDDSTSSWQRPRASSEREPAEIWETQVTAAEQLLPDVGYAPTPVVPKIYEKKYS